MRRKLRMGSYIPYSYKMMIPYLLLVLLTDALIGTISYRMLVDSRTEIAQTNIRAAMQQTRSSMKYQMDEITRISDTLFGSVPFQKALQKHGDDLQTYLTMLDEVVPQLRAPLQLFGSNLRIVLYTTNPDLYEIEGDDLNTPIQDSDYYVLSADRVAGSAWVSEASEGVGAKWMQVDSDAALGNLSHLTRLISYNDYQTVIGYIRITTSLDELLGRFEAFPEEKGITLQLLDDQSEAVTYQKGGAEAAEERYLALNEAIPGTGYSLRALVSQEYLQEDAKRLRLLILGVCSASFAVMALIGLLVARLSGRKMRKIVTLLQSFQDGSFEKRIRFGGRDEFVQIAQAFNNMASHIKELINSVYVQGLSRKQAELEALQAQINPHFLYNTLSTISSLANMGQAKEVTEMVKGLSRFYRLSLNGGKVYIPLGLELEQIQTYLDIQRVKYADSFTVYMDIEEGIRELQVMKLILQPFVENIFKHAWFGDSIGILIAGRVVGGMLELKIIDNGIGMRPDALREIISGPNRNEGGYGIRNVNERIKLRYGPEYGVDAASIYGAGTTVRILLPADSDFAEEQDGAGLQPADRRTTA
ncbi:MULTISPECIES: sensor histidine kinase [unclassified Paenibacillus]|uniref:sensor histidine kinase n=1 Tax=unclassified Paenibacillus TaxID=185978 RepID=UPI000954B432|nr:MULTISPECIES: sensor histidine kinase [unclassified Paenibacillus]SIR54772.1 Sensor histidine kinase YesM [Paenibacillus sp. RU4X]SIR63298.1 Sensor histidine kinase YesM [Paenibacillus sp. RU4T]